MTNVVFKRCPLYVETLAKKAVGYPVIVQKLNEFILFKGANPNSRFGARDTAFEKTGNVAKYIPGLRHAHLTHDIMIVYAIGGSNPTEFKLYGLFSHDELGIGSPSNMKRQKSAAARLSNQNF